MRIADKIQLSSRSTKILSEYYALLQTAPKEISSIEPLVDWVQLINVLTEDYPCSITHPISLKNKSEYVRASLHASLLQDIALAIDSNVTPAPKDENNFTSANQVEYMLLAVSGAMLAACEGFDSITTMADILPLTPIFILAVGMFLASLSVIAFLGIDLVQVAQKLRINSDHDLKQVDTYLLQWKEIRFIRRKIASLPLAELSVEELANFELLTAGLQKQIYNILDSGERYKEELNHFDIKVAKTIITIIFGIMYFGMGYFAGQSVALYLLGFFIAAVTPTFWAVIAFSALAGLSGFALYWNDRKVDLDKLVSSWMGLDEDKIDKIADKVTMEEQVEKLEKLKHQLRSTAALIYKSVNSENLNHREDPGKCTRAFNESVVWGNRPGVAVGSNIYSFHHSNASNEQEVAYDVVSDKFDCTLL